MGIFSKGRIKMLHSKKAIEMSFNTIVIAIICLVVLLVIIAIFTGQIGGVAKGFTKIREKEIDQSALGKDLFGCSEGSKCTGNIVYVCQDSKWVKGKDCGSQECKDGACV